MQIGGGGSSDINVLFSDSAALRNEDFVVNNGFAYADGHNTGALASNNAHVQLFNPAGSGVDLMIDMVTITTDAIGVVFLLQYDTELTNSLGPWNPVKLGGTVGNGILRWQYNAGVLGTSVGVFRCAANTPLILPLKFPIMIGEGRGLVATNSTVNSRCDTTFFGREV